MPRPLSFLLPSLVLVACEPRASKESQVFYPVLSASVETLEFGDVAWGQTVTERFNISNKGDHPLGIGDIRLNTEEMEDNWTISYDFANVDCPASQGDSGDGGGDGGATDGGGTDGGSGDGGSGDGGGTEGSSTSMFAASTVDTGGWGSGNDAGSDEEVARILGPGCRLPIEVTLEPDRIGTIYGSIVIESVGQDDVPEDEDQSYWADPNNSFITVIIKGNGDKGAPNIYVSPRALDFGTVWEGDALSLLVDIANTGGGDLELKTPYFDAEACDDGFSIDWSFGEGTILPEDGLTGVEVTFTPTSDDGANCTLWVESNDPDEPYVDIPMQGNVGTDTEECFPTVNLITPEIGFEHLNGQDLDLVFETWDCNQPAYTLKLQIRSGVLSAEAPVLVDTFYAPDESGYVEAKVPRDKLGRGTDTIIVRATDSAGNITQAATTILYRATFPASDDDGDGYGTDGETAEDCDDGDKYSFPGAAERYDGKDNDCDGVIDEGTEGSDDDGDGYSEADGDCDDNDPETYPGAEEVPDYRDNDCDGDIDENTTLADDDGDGYSESEGDCNDNDPSISPTATEFCDGVDNDCNGLSDERDGCVDLDSDPMIIGCIQVDKTKVAVGEQATLKALAYDSDGDPISYSWSQDSKLANAGYVSLDSLSSSTTTFTAPAVIEGNKAQETYTFTVTVSDPSHNTAACAVDLVVSAESVDEFYIDQERVGSSCKDNSSAALLLPGLFSLLALRRRRRED